MYVRFKVLVSIGIYANADMCIHFAGCKQPNLKNEGAVGAKRMGVTEMG